jgi:hypothetical protein
MMDLIGILRPLSYAFFAIDFGWNWVHRGINCVASHTHLIAVTEIYIPHNRQGRLSSQTTVGDNNSYH